MSTVTTKKAKSSGKGKMYNRGAWKYAIPAFIPLVLLSVVPLSQAIWTSFTDNVAGFEVKVSFIGLDNFQRLLGDKLFWASFKIGIIWAVSVTLLALVLGFGLALLLNQKLRFLGIMRVLSLVPWAMPPVIVAIMWNLLLRPTSGPIDGILEFFHESNR